MRSVGGMSRKQRGQPGKSKAKKEAYPEMMRANQEELETNLLGTDAAARYYKWAQHVKATHEAYHPTRPGFRSSTWRS
jgi:hypothetical protein